MFSFKPRATKVSSPATRPPVSAQPRVNLHVDFEDKDEVKECGAKWDAKLKTWYAQTPYALLSLTDTKPLGPERLWVHVDFENRKEARGAGASWDTEAKCWYAPDCKVFEKLIEDGVAELPNAQYTAYANQVAARLGGVPGFEQFDITVIDAEK
jgi:hypothetical protein